jgi:hypothetical protein
MKFLKIISIVVFAISALPRAIALTVAKGKVIGFREYLGDVEPLWFQKK